MMKSWRSRTAAALVVGAAAVAIPLTATSASAASPSTTASHGPAVQIPILWKYVETVKDLATCDAKGQALVDKGEAVDHSCSKNDKGTWDLYKGVLA